MMSKKLDLFLLSEDDLHTILIWRNAPEVRANMYTQHEIQIEEHCRWYESLKGDNSKAYFIAKLNNEPVGVVGFTEIDHVSHMASWAFYMSPEAPRGTGALMEFKALEYAFSTLSLYKLRCEVLSFNKSVVKLHTKFGFRVEGTHRSAFFDGDEYHDVVHLGLISDEWDMCKTSLIKRLKLTE